MEDLLLARAAQIDKKFPKTIDHEIFLTAEKRYFDQKFFIHLRPSHKKVEVVEVKELSLFNAYTPGKPCLEIAVMVDEKKPLYKTIRTGYEVVDRFSFKSDMLSLGRFIERDQFLLFQ
jgi:hypothetical protein